MCCKHPQYEVEVEQLACAIKRVADDLLQGEEPGNPHYWEDQFYAFYNGTLGEHFQKYLSGVYRIELELDELLKVQDDKLDRYGEDYPMFLYINYLLNRLDRREL